jgi:glycosyltransferase involved in cell wall biosynthesis
VVESFAKGTPVIAARAGALPELVVAGVNGWSFEPGNIAELSARLGQTLDGGNFDRIRAAARASFQEQFTADRNYEILRRIYELTIAGVRSSGRTACR